MTCDKCGRPAPNLTGVQTAPATHSSPAEGEMWCDECIETAREYAEYAEEMESLRGYSDEERERI
jgi:hypothetical protein